MMNEQQLSTKVEILPSTQAGAFGASGTVGSVVAPQAQAESRLALLYPILAGLLFLAYCFYNFVIPQTPGRIIRPTAALIEGLPLWSAITSLPLPIPTSAPLLSGLLLLFGGAAFAAYGLALYLSWRQPDAVSRPLVIGAGLIFFLLSVLALPNVNTDIYHYILHGRIAAIYHSNPYYVLADEFPEDPIYPYASHKYTNRPGDKLPAWMVMNIFLARAAGDNPVTNLLLYRSVLLLFNAANIGLIALIAGRLSPPHLPAAVVLYAWNPIVVLFGQSKIDTVMVFYLLLAVLLLLGGRRGAAVVLMGLSVLVKLITLPLVAVYFLGALRRGRWKQLVVSALLLGLTTVLLYAAFWDGPSLLVELIGLMSLGGGYAPGNLRFLLKVGFVLLAFWFGLTQGEGEEPLLRIWTLLMLYFSLFLTQLGFSWYLITLIALAALVFDWRLATVTVALSFSSFLFNTWYSTFSSEFRAPELSSLPRFLIYAALPSIIGAGLAARALWQRGRQRPKVDTSSNA